MAPVFLLQDIIQDHILTRLPIKSLIRCRCVCKLWNSLFFNTRFALSHFKHSISQNPNDDYLITINTFQGTSRCVISLLSRTNLSESRLVKIPYPLSSNVDDIYLVGSINGLVCIVFLKGLNYYFILWNPATHYFSKTILLPRRGPVIFSYPVAYLFGFGWDFTTDDVKLIANPSSSLQLRAVVYSRKTDSWSTNVTVSKISPLNISRCRSPCVIVKGIPYWNFPRISQEIIKFDVRTNEFSRMCPFPFTQNFSLVNIDDSLGLIQYGSTSFVYGFNEEANCWSKMHSVYSSNVNVVNVPTLGSKYGGEIVLNGNENILYDRRSNQIRSIDYNNRGFSVHGSSYTPSLLSPEGV
ncbi:F-box/kelch-repeat protein At3g23880-like [Apium graveolens]|uniref:F-box/kelch-repeat protein At3g23880-like n=1 Tax=Apium graveolens TaxID=4045 RepID=UPI003D7990C5